MPHADLTNAIHAVSCARHGLRGNPRDHDHHGDRQGPIPALHHLAHRGDPGGHRADPPAQPKLHLARQRLRTNASINEAASATGLNSVSTNDFDGTRHWSTNSTDRTFTTAP
jgi:hypothetical protein